MEQTLNTNTKAHRGLSGTAIKLIALSLMLLDHIQYFFEFTGVIPIWFSMLGRLSAWMFLFITVEGFVHTSNRKKYFLRVWIISACMGFINYAISQLLVRGDGFYPINNFLATIAVLMVLWQGIDWLKEKSFIKGFSALLLPFLLLFALTKLPASILPWAFLVEQTLIPLPLITEGGLPFLVGGLVLYIFHSRRKLQVALWAAVVLGWNLYIGIAFGLPFGMQWITFHYEWMGVFASIPMLMYNGEKGRGMKKLFYAFYPAHVYILWALSMAVYAFMK